MSKLVLIAALAGAALASAGCLSSTGSSPNSSTTGLDSGSPEAGPPVETVDGSVSVDAAVTASLTTGLGSGVVAHSAHFTIITKTGQVPGAGIKSSANFKVISGAAPAASAK
jgi:hypothetical protein